MSYGRMSRFPSYNIAKIAAVVITFIVIIVVMIESVVIVEAGHRGVVLYLGAVENRVLGGRTAFHSSVCRASNTNGSPYTKIPG